MNEDQKQFDRMAGIYNMQLNQVEHDIQSMRRKALISMIGHAGRKVYRELKKKVVKDKQQERTTYNALIENVKDGNAAEAEFFGLGPEIDNAQGDMVRAMVAGAIA